MWESYLEENWESKNGPYEFADLEDHLLSIGGEKVIKGFAMDLELSRIIEDGGVDEPLSTGPEMVELDDSECHFNSARLWMSKYDEFGGCDGHAGRWNIVTGYSLGPDDGCWREHTWLTDEREFIVETTVPRDMYYGVELENHAEAKAFCGGEGVWPLSGN